MRILTTNSKEAGVEQSPTKQDWETPTLTVLGDAEELTTAAIGVGGDAGAFS